MIQTAAAYENLADICAVPGIDAVYVGPADLAIALGGRYFGDPHVARRPSSADSTIVTILPDTGERYLSVWA